MEPATVAVTYCVQKTGVCSAPNVSLRSRALRKSCETPTKGSKAKVNSHDVMHHALRLGGIPDPLCIVRRTPLDMNLVRSNAVEIFRLLQESARAGGRRLRVKNV